MLAIIFYAFYTQSLEVLENPSYRNVHYSCTLPIFQGKLLVLVGNTEVGDFVFPKVMVYQNESAAMAAKRGAFTIAGCTGDLSTSPFFVEGNTWYFVLDIFGEEPEWNEGFKDRKSIALSEVEYDPTIGNHEKYIINQCMLQGFIVY